MTLPIDAILPALLTALEERTSAVLVAPPGSGKTTRVPLALREAPWRKDGRIILLSPRRVAARAAAARLAHHLGEPVGRTVGYRVRLESRTSAATRLEVVTEGVFARMIVADPSLSGVAAILFDEFHERSLEGDLGLALALDAQGGLREDLRLLVMSATMDAAQVAAMLDDAPVISSEGRAHPVNVRHLGADPARRSVEERVADAVAAAVRTEQGGVLAFLPGAREIERCARILGHHSLGDDCDVHALYGALDPRAQDAAIAPAPHGRRKIVLATSIAETSLTIEGVRIVIDSGLARRPRYDPGTGLARLETVRASRASVEQRAGRAGRTGPGICWRLWDAGETRALAPFDKPEILEADLSALVLDLAAWGVADPGSLKWLDPPPAAALSEARATLHRLGALDEAGLLTAHGRTVSDMPLHPRLAHMVAVAAEGQHALFAAKLAVLVSEQGLGGRDVDLNERLRRLDADTGSRAQAARALAVRIARRFDGPQDKAGDCGAMLARAWPERVARSRGQGGAFLMANGRAGALDMDDPLSRQRFIVVVDASGPADRLRVHSAAPIAEAAIESLFADAIATEDVYVVDDASGAVRARRRRALGAIALSETPLQALDGARAGGALAAYVRDEWPASLLEPVRQLRARVALLRGLEPEGWPDWSDDALRFSVDEWFAAAGAHTLDAVDMRGLLLGALSHAQRRRLETEAPERFATPAGGDALIDYAVENGPAIDVRLQELFGTTAHPAVAGGRAPLLVRLLSPAGRPIQSTRDLPGFWRGSYEAVRRDMKGRYPKHPWPDDPVNAAPTRRAKPRGT